MAASVAVCARTCLVLVQSSGCRAFLPVAAGELCIGRAVGAGTSLSEFGYIVFNPATQQWSALPSDRTPADRHIQWNHTCLVFDPAVSPHFRLVILRNYREEGSLATVHSYSSETRLWRHTQIDWADKVKQLGYWNLWHPQIRGTPAYAALLNSMLYLLLTDNQIAEVDLEGKTKRVIPAPSSFPPYVPCFLDFLSVAHHEEKLGVSQRDKREGRRQGR
ncbi:unnamed protein product [Miscanthus lutarioriparius]|uniref:Uncharacterized protein n=1 Tax=Miscanthus lutarioriparius TaxID=422564 RepID=A0A811SPV3_9POAL|nr:unnamed protein product [Miscanthus lutarioriparius]